MTVGEFKAWLEGYLEGNSKPSTKRIKAQAEKLVAETVTIPSPYPVYQPPYWRQQPYTYWDTGTITTTPTWIVLNDQLTVSYNSDNTVDCVANV